MKTKKSFTFNKLYLFAFLIPAVIMLVIFAIREIYPFGDRSFLHIDMYHQYFPFLVEFYHKLKNERVSSIPGIPVSAPTFWLCMSTIWQALRTGWPFSARKDT